MIDMKAAGPRLRSAAEALGVKFDTGVQEKLLQYVNQLARWNKTYNLTAIRDPDTMLVNHLFDSLAVIPPITEILYKNTVSEHSNVEPIVVDVGSGAGLPGAVLALCGIGQIHCVDAVQKKVTFIRQMAGQLQCPELIAHHQRIEQMPSLNADIVISRAFSSLTDFVRLSGHHAGKHGVLVAMKGHEPKEEIESLHDETDWRVSQLIDLSVPELEANRCLLVLKPKDRQ